MIFRYARQARPNVLLFTNSRMIIQGMRSLISPMEQESPDARRAGKNPVRSPIRKMDSTPLKWSGRLSRAIASLLIPHGFPGCSVLLRNGYKLLGAAPPGSVCVRTRHGFSMLVDPRRNKGLDASIYFNGTYEAGSIFVITQTLRPGDVFIDVGANIGLMTLAAAQTVGSGGRVHAFEPVPSVHAILLRNLALNKCGNVIPHAVALGSTVETLTIYWTAGRQQRQRDVC